MGQPLTIPSGDKIRLKNFDPADTGKYKQKSDAEAETRENAKKIGELVYRLYAEKQQSVLVVLQGIDTAGKDGATRAILDEVNPLGICLAAFKRPTEEELGHDFLWRIHKQVPGKGEMCIFNRSHYEDVLVVRVHQLVPKAVWSKRYALINDFEKLLAENGTRILKFFLHISPEEQLLRFKQRLDDPARNWKISEGDYSEREFWTDYVEAYEEALSKTSSKEAPWYVIPANHKWFRNLAISQIIADTMEEMGLKLPPTRVDLKEIATKYHAAEVAQEKRAGKTPKPTGKK